MATTYTLRPVSKSYYQITTGRNKAGHVQVCPEGWVARLGQHCETASTAKEAFRLVAAKALGHDSPAALAQHNRVVRRRNSLVRAEANHRLDQKINEVLGHEFIELVNRIRGL